MLLGETFFGGVTVSSTALADNFLLLLRLWRWCQEGSNHGEYPSSRARVCVSNFLLFFLSFLSTFFSSAFSTFFSTAFSTVFSTTFSPTHLSCKMSWFPATVTSFCSRTLDINNRLHMMNQVISPTNKCPRGHFRFHAPP